MPSYLIYEKKDDFYQLVFSVQFDWDTESIYEKLVYSIYDKISDSKIAFYQNGEKIWEHYKDKIYKN